MNINLRDIAVVRLTPDGYNVLMEYDTLFLKKLNEDTGELRVPVWVLFNIFNNHIGMGNKKMFVNDTITIEK